jgi:hypothetical protein
MSIKIVCPACWHFWYADETQYGKRTKCPECHKALMVPAAPPQRGQPENPTRTRGANRQGQTSEGEPTSD